VPINRERVGASFEVPAFTVTAEQIEAYADATLDSLPAYRGQSPLAPPVFGIVPVWKGVQAALADRDLGIDVARVVHGEQRMRFQRALRAGERLHSTGELSSVDERGENEIFVLSFTIVADGEPVVTQDVVCVSRGTAGGGEAASGRRPGSARPKAEGGGEREPDETRVVDLPEDITYRYAAASGDDNRIHVDPEFAREAGLPGIIVHGLCMLSIALQGVVERFAGGDPDRVRSLGVRFSRPLRPGTPLETRIWNDPEGVRFESSGPDGAAVLKDGHASLSRS
jgi:acyl dehydratase